MQIARIIGRATSTIKHPALNGWRLLIAQPVNEHGAIDGSPQLVLDRFGAGRGDKVIISSDGKSARDMVGNDKAPARWTVMGIID